MRLFVMTEHCKSRVHCGLCRNKEDGFWWRQDLSTRYTLPEDNNPDFECPFGLEWGYKPPKRPEPPPQPVRQRIAMPKLISQQAPPVETQSSGCGCSRKKKNA